MFFKRAKKADERVADAAVAPEQKQPASTHAAISPEKLRRDTDAGKLGFKSTADIARGSVEPLDARKVWDELAAALAPRTGKPLRDVLITAPPGSGAAHAVAARLAAMTAAVDATAHDWIFLRGEGANAGFMPVAVPAGQGRRFAAGIEAVVTQLRRTLPYLLSSEDLARRRASVEAGYTAIRDDAFARLNASAHAQNVAVLTTPLGFAVAPMHEGKVVRSEVLARLPQAMRDDVRRKVESVEAELQTLLSEVPSEAGSHVSDLTELVSDYVRPAISNAFEGLVKEFSSVAPAMGFLTATQEDILRRACRDGATLALPDYCGRVIEGAGKSLVSLDTAVSGDALAQALLRAGKGVAVIDAGTLDGASWALLKAALRSRTVAFDDAPRHPVPIACGVVLVQDTSRRSRSGETLADLLATSVAFADDAARNEENEAAIARILGAAAEQRTLLPLDADAVALLVGEAARASGRPDRLSADLTQPLATAATASRIATQASRSSISGADINAALAERQNGASVQPLFAPAQAATVGRVMAIGLAPEPVEVWAMVRPGRGTVGDIARATAPGSDTASPALALLWSLLSSRCPATQPLALAAAIVHEPPISAAAAVRASAAEVYAVLSTLADAPIPASFAVAGWIAPSGALLPLSDINVAIESAFDRLGGRDAARSLSIVIPKANEAGLMLRSDVVDAARKGTVKVFAAATLDEGLAILTGTPMAAPGDGSAEPGLNRRIEERLGALARQYAAAEASVRGVSKGAPA
jgi:hypothetical protein